MIDPFISYIHSFFVMPESPWAMSPPHPSALRNQGVLQMSGEVNLGEDDVESTTLVDTLGTKLTPHGTVFLDARDSFVVAFFGVGKILGRSWESEVSFCSSVFEFLKETITGILDRLNMFEQLIGCHWTCLNNFFYSKVLCIPNHLRHLFWPCFNVLTLAGDSGFLLRRHQWSGSDGLQEAASTLGHWAAWNAWVLDGETIRMEVFKPW